MMMLFEEDAAVMTMPDGLCIVSLPTLMSAYLTLDVLVLFALELL
jgi:hypothetical protein